MTATHVIKLQARTTNGVLHVETHDHHLEYPPTKAIDNHFSGVVTYKPCEVERLEEIKMHIFRVRLHDNIYCMKTVHRTGRETDFIREVMTLQQCSHPNILRLVRLVEAEGSEKIEGMLTEYISKGRVLRDIDVLSVDEFKRWTQQIQEAVAYIHEKGLVWGDAKAANVLIDDIGNAILIDFSGGFTKGWVDEVNHDTPRGDIQGQEKIIDFMKERRPQ
jgi:serine/threonine protein kinase